MTNNFRARTAQEQAALEKLRAAFRSSCSYCMKIRARCPVCAGVF